jgi:iron(III) transport system ATP-binding protein
VELSTREQAEIIQETDIDRIITPGSRVILSVNMKKINLFDAETERSIMKGVVNRIDG